jgi:hypothetical protein
MKLSTERRQDLGYAGKAPILLPAGRQANTQSQTTSKFILPQNTRLLRFARNDNINKVKLLVSLRGVPQSGAARRQVKAQTIFKFQISNDNGFISDFVYWVIGDYLEFGVRILGFGSRWAGLGLPHELS